MLLRPLRINGKPVNAAMMTAAEVSEAARVGAIRCFEGIVVYCHPSLTTPQQRAGRQAWARHLRQ